MKRNFWIRILMTGTVAATISVSAKTVQADELNGYNSDLPQIEAEGLEESNGQDIGADDSHLYRAAIPAKYVTDNLPTIKDQKPYGACWAFVMTSLAEINISQKSGKQLDLSEMQLINFTYDGTNDPLGGFEGDSNYCSDNSDKLELGCNYEFASSSLSNWKGYTDESVLPYNIGNATAVEDGTIDKNLAYDDTVHINELRYGDIINDRDNVKQLVLDYGAVGVSYYNQSGYYNGGSNSYYCDSEQKGNHAVAVVGWDDNYPADKFSTDPGADGAWLIRNSWGSYDDEYNYNGYFWMSYYDKSLGKTAIAVDAVTSDDNEFYDNNYQYDGSIYSATCRAVGAANVYTAKKGYERLKSVSFVTDDVNENYEIRIYQNLTNESDPQSGTLVDTISGTTTFKGMYQAKLNKTVNIVKDQKYSVVIELTKQDGTRGAFRCETNGYVSSLRFVSAAPEHSSFVWSAGKWVDVNSINGIGNIRIKAYTDNQSGLVNAGGQWGYYEAGVLKTNLTTLMKYNGSWWYIHNGLIDWGYTGLVKYNDNWFYIKNGKVDFSATTLCKYNGSWWYVRAGAVDFTAATLCKYNGNWFYVKNGKVNFNERTLVKYNGNWFYVKNGIVNFNERTLVKYNGNWFYVKNGIVNFNERTLVKYNGNWFYIKNGIVNFNETTLVKYNGNWFYINSGMVNWNYNGKCWYNAKLFDIKGGIVRF